MHRLTAHLFPARQYCYYCVRDRFAQRQRWIKSKYIPWDFWSLLSAALLSSVHSKWSVERENFRWCRRSRSWVSAYACESRRTTNTTYTQSNGVHLCQCNMLPLVACCFLSFWRSNHHPMENHWALNNNDNDNNHHYHGLLFDPCVYCFSNFKAEYLLLDSRKREFDATRSFSTENLSHWAVI